MEDKPTKNEDKGKNFEIKPIKGQKKYIFSDSLPAHPSRMLLCGVSELSGKTTVLLNLLDKKTFPYFKFYGKENIYIVSPTINDDKRWARLKLPEENVVDNYDQEFIAGVIEKVEENKTPSLIIFDDVIPIRGTKSENENLISLFVKGRHYGEDAGLSIWISTQYYRALYPVIRTNCSNLCFWLASDLELNKFFEEHSQGLKKKDWLELYYHCVHEPHSFLHINYSNTDLHDGRFIRNFEAILKLNSVLPKENDLKE